jgi:hypothetical protein
MMAIHDLIKQSLQSISKTPQPTLYQAFLE